jgi:hypothetical protein
MKRAKQRKKGSLGRECILSSQQLNYTELSLNLNVGFSVFFKLKDINYINTESRRLVLPASKQFM